MVAVASSVCVCIEPKINSWSVFTLSMFGLVQLNSSFLGHFQTWPKYLNKYSQVSFFPPFSGGVDKLGLLLHTQICSNPRRNS